MLKKLGAAGAVAILLATSACGGGRPTEKELSSALQKGTDSGGSTLKLNKKQADCVAKVFEESKLSDDALQAIADRDEKYKESKADSAEVKKIGNKLASCVTPS